MLPDRVSNPGPLTYQSSAFPIALRRPASRQEARDRRQSRQKPNMKDSLCRKRKLADAVIPCVNAATNSENLDAATNSDISL